MRYRQVHLDFHTSEAIGGIGKNFSKKQFQDMLKLGHVNSITVFAKCHHGWSYHPTKVGEIHPGLDFDLLKEMIDAAHEIDVKTPVYISAGLDEKLTRRHPEWLIRHKDERLQWAGDFFTPGYHEFCFNSPYLDYLIAQIEEVVTNYDADGIFLDIVGVRKCYCQNCIRTLIEEGKDPQDENAVIELGERTFANYANRVEKAVHRIKPDMKIFHNSGHIRRGRRDLAAFNTHLELESLPTGGWGYDHFPLSARYVQNLGMDYLGMTGKFHTTWGEFGGYKHPNALRYETALSLANGAACSIGDQLHPEGLMDEATYALIGIAYKEVEEKEKWCIGAENIADVAILSLEAIGVNEDKAKSGANDRSGKSDAGAVRILLEGKFLFDVIDLEEDFNKYKVVILPDKVRITPDLKAKLENFFKNGGKVFATGESGLSDNSCVKTGIVTGADTGIAVSTDSNIAASTDTGIATKDSFAIDLGVRWLGENPYKPDYFRPNFELKNFRNASFVCYSQGQKVELVDGIELGKREDPYFNRSIFAFCSHQHSPNSYRYGGPGMVESSNGIYFAWNLFEEYATKGSIILKEIAVYALEKLLAENRTLTTNLPAQGIVILTKQDEHKRYVTHLLYASPVRRGENIEVIEDIIPLYNIEVTVNLPVRAKNVYLVPQNIQLDFTQEDSKVKYTVPRLECHQMVVIEHD